MKVKNAYQLWPVLNRREFILGSTSVALIGGVNSRSNAAFNGSGLSLRLAATTTIRDSGLLANLLNSFSTEHGIKVQPLVRSTGAALYAATQGDIDALIVHDPEKETNFTKTGLVHSDKEFMMNRFILVGPAHYRLKISSENLHTAFQSIMQYKLPFISRADESGTHAAERRIWKSLNFNPSQMREDWYWKAGVGMGAALNIAMGSGRAILTDYATWEYFSNKNKLVVLTDGKKDKLARNIYSYIVLKKRSDRMYLAEMFGTWLLSPRGRELIENYRINQKKVFETMKVS